MYGEIPYMGSRLLKGLKKKPPMRDAPGALLCRIRIKKTSFFLPFYFFTFKEYSW